ncbi:MAG: hypothetical protein JST92_23655 [Deltaproteobacteria bacterium]|nr:hypothetical protein [Deltaproteobacteria bacterium]
MQMNPRSRPAAFAAVVLAGAAAIAACQDSFNPVCPTGTRNEGSFLATFTPLPAATDCRITSDSDGGALDASLASTPAAVNTTICSLPPPDGGTPTVYMEFNSNLPRVSTLDDGGTFVFTSSTTISGSACVCNIDVTETISGTLLPADGTDAAVTFDVDAGGFTPMRGFTATIVDAVDGGAGCHCNIPCSIQYRLDGTK